ncbi:MAG: hypothetical protein HN368_02840, partial [Spirochaetales bacterium]|nr:hypothetical protein [Spirochaetales bacterium]
MSEIKSAWEIALERTKDIQGDKDTLKSSERKNDGKRLASAFINPAEDMDEKTASGKIKSYSGKDQSWIREGFFSVMSANLNLPIDDTFAAKLEMLEKGLQLVVKEKKQVSFIFEQICQFFDQYLQGRTQMLEALKQQYEPQLREKERALEQQMGAKVNLT